ncbi:hypothetical protein IAX14_001729 [Vibrio parahaemolyticus]|nr:hypothetical protein [Vibrio parahaemolyticus]
MNWGSKSASALVEALIAGEGVRRTAATRRFLDELQSNMWVRETRGQFFLYPEKAGLLRQRQDAASKPLPATGDVRSIARSRLKRFWQLPVRLHHKIAAAYHGHHAKSGSVKPLKIGQQLTGDDVLRLRSRDPWVLHFGDKSLDVAEETVWADEVCLGERAWLSLTNITRQPDTLVTVENVCYIDLPLLSGAGVMLIPGNNQTLAVSVIRCLRPKQVIHLPDLDQAGLDLADMLARQLADVCPVNCLIPDCSGDYLHAFGQEMNEKKKPWQPITPSDHPTIIMLKKRGWWMEQEPMILDRRLSRELAAMIESESTS